MANANFTPDIGPYTTLKPFRFWCQKVLPLVYDDSLSYYELLGKVVDYLNKTMEDVDTQITDIQGLLSAYEALQGWVNHYYDSADFAADIDAGLDRMAESGQLTTLLTAIVNPELPGLVDDLLPEVVLTLLPDEVSSQIGGTVANQLPAVVSNQIPGTVATQLPGVVSNQIPGTVATQLPAVVSNQIGPVVEDKIVDPVEDWLDANVSGGIAVDRTLSVLGAGADAAFTGARLETLDNTLGYEHVADTGFIITTANPFAFNYGIINDLADFSDLGTHTYKLMVIPVNTGDKYCINAHKISIANITADHFAITYAFCAKWVGDPDIDTPYYVPTTYIANDAENTIATVPEITIPTGQGYDETTGYLVVITANIEDPVYKVVDEGLRKDVSDLKSDVSELSDAVSITTLLTLSDTVNTGKYLSASQNSYGQLVDGAAPSQWEYTDYVDVSGYSKVAITAYCYTNRLYYCFYDANKNPIANSGKAYNGDVLEDYIVDVPNGAKYCIATFYYGSQTDDPIIKGVEVKPNLTGAVLYNKSIELSDTQKGTARDNIDAISKTVGKNLFNPSAVSSGYISSNTGAITASADYTTSDFIPIASGQKIVFTTQIRKFLAYNANKEAITNTYETYTQAAGYVYTASENGYIRASFFNTNLSDVQIEYGDTPTEYEPYRIQVENNIYLSNSMKKQVESSIGNPLSGKKWVACGDSFTAGDFTNTTSDDITFTAGKYKGRYKVYPYWIGNRNETLDVINEAIGGSTIAGGTYGNNPFSGTRYTNIPSDTDYITLMFGINDSSRGVPIGTIDDDDNTTFYGAWNIVLEYFTENFPFAHIGIIVGPGMQTATAYAEAEIAVAKKWGIPYLDIQFKSGEEMPLMLRTSNPNVSADIKALRDSQQYVNSGDITPNHHPNEKAHELESAFIEAFLKRI